MNRSGRIFAMTLDLESDFSGALRNETSLLLRLDSVEHLLHRLEDRNVKLSVFTVGQLLERFPKMIELLVRYGAEFHCHSYSHDPAAPDSEEEIRRSREVFIRYFGRPPQGYRAPDGRISPQGIGLLERYGFKFDASIFPSYYPNPLKYLFRNSQVHYFRDSGLVEIPNTPISPLRIMLSLSYVKLLGIGLYRRMLRWSRLPDTAVFGAHLHDFFTDDEALERMSRFWGFVYRRNQHQGLTFMEDILDYFHANGYDFVYISEIYRGFVGDRNP
jgi:hypothetical protein